MKTIDTTTKRFKRFKQISALVGVVLLVAMYIVAIAAAIIGTETAKAYFLTAIYSSFVIPVIIYLLQLLYKVITKQNDNE